MYSENYVEIEYLKKHLQYITHYKDAYLKEIRTKVTGKKLGIIVNVCGLLGILTLCLSLFFFLGSFFLDSCKILFEPTLIAAAIFVSVTELIINTKTICTYRKEVAKLTKQIEESEKQEQQKEEHLQKQAEEEKKKQDEELRNTDKFIISIAKDISNILQSPYSGYEEHVSALYALSQKYLEKKKESQLDTIELLTQYPNYNMILWEIEAQANQQMQSQASLNLDYEQVSKSLEGAENILRPMSEEELLAFLPEEPKVTLELPKINYKKL